MTDLIIFIGYLICILSIGIYAGLKSKDIEDFSVAGRNLPLLLIFATFSAFIISERHTLDITEKVFLFGITNIFALLGLSIKEFLIAFFIAPQMQDHSDCISIGDIIGNHYGKFAKILTGIISAFFCIIILSFQLTIFGFLLKHFFGIELFYGILLGISLIILYGIVGGLRSIAYTHFIQILLISLSVLILLYFGVSQASGWANILSAVPNKHLSFFGNLSLSSFLSFFLVFMLGEAFLPPYVQRLLSSKNTQNLKYGLIINGVFSIFLLTAIGIIGIIAYALFPTVNAEFAILHLINSLIPVGFKGIVIIGLSGIILSSADSFLNSASVSITNDVIKPIFKDSDIAGSIWVARVFMILLGSLAVILSLYSKNLNNLMIISYKFWSPIILVPLIVAIYDIKATKEQFYKSIIAGISATFLWSYILHDLYNFQGLLIGILTSLIAFIFYHYFGEKKPVKKNV